MAEHSLCACLGRGARCPVVPTALALAGGWGGLGTCSQAGEPCLAQGRAPASTAPAGHLQPPTDSHRARPVLASRPELIRACTLSCLQPASPKTGRAEELQRGAPAPRGAGPCPTAVVLLPSRQPCQPLAAPGPSPRLCPSCSGKNGCGRHGPGRPPKALWFSRPSCWSPSLWSSSPPQHWPPRTPQPQGRLPRGPSLGLWPLQLPQPPGPQPRTLLWPAQRLPPLLPGPEPRAPARSLWAAL